MSRVFKLAIASLKEHPARVVLTSIATAAATCMVIWLSSGYDALLDSFDVWARVALGRYELAIAPIESDDEAVVPVEVVEALRADPAVAEVVPMWMLDAVVKGNAAPGAASEGQGDGPPRGGPGARPNPRSEHRVICTNAPMPPFEIEGNWVEPGQDERLEAVLRADTAERLQLALGDLVTVVGKARKSYALRVVGLLQAPTLNAGAYAVPSMETPGSGDLFLSTELGERIFSRSAPVSFIGLSLNPEADVTKFRFGWAPKLSRFSTPVQFQESIEIEEKLDESSAADNVRLQSFAATGVGLLLAMIVIFSTINMGVTERIRQLAMLRAVAFTRLQVFSLVYLESLFMAALGFLGGLGLGALLLAVTAERSSRLLHHGAGIGPKALTLAIVCTFGAAILAAAWPAWRATRVRPVDAMAPRPQSSAGLALPVPAVVAGALLVVVNPVLTFVLTPGSERESYLHLVIGFLAMGLGFVLLAPAVVALVDRIAGPVLARLMRIDPKLLASQITSHVWRTAAAAISMAVGLGLFIGIQVWGFTMLDAFVVGPWAPDAVLVFPDSGMPRDEFAEFAAIEGVAARACLPVVVEQPRLLHDITGSGERASVTRQDNIVIVGIDPDGFVGGEHPLFAFEWVVGSPASAVEIMRRERACVVPDHFLVETGLEVGDGFELVPPEDASRTARYTIAGAVRMPGWHWQTKLTGFRSRTHRAAAMAFANYEFVAADFELPAATHAWFDYDSDRADPDRIEEDARQLFRRSTSRAESDGDAGGELAELRIMSVEAIRDMTRVNAARWIWGISQLPLAAVLIAGIGVLNIILASVRARRWELGVMRSIGISRSEISRAILAEGILIGVTACVVGGAFGLLTGWCGCGMAQYMSFFGGLHPALDVPLGAITIGLLATVLTAMIAAAWPTLSIGRRRPIELLQAGQLAS